jgi:hypothetical protein
LASLVKQDVKGLKAESHLRHSHMLLMPIATAMSTKRTLWMTFSAQFVTEFDMDEIPGYDSRSDHVT